MLEVGADPNAPVPMGMTALHEATMVKSRPLATKLFELLLAHKAEPSFRDINGKTPVDRATGGF